MKKSLFFVAAASALMLTACSSEGDVLQSATPTQQQSVVERAVGFDIYTPAASNATRAGLEGTMTTNRLQRTQGDGGGFGVYAYLVEDAIPASGDNNATGYDRNDPGKPNFMVNEKLLWNATNQGWYYSPLKYWPNETDNDSQGTAAEMIGSSSTSHLDRLTFFAYAPYVETGFTPGSTGITAITTMNETTEPSITYAVAKDNPNAAVDLLWGVAPAGGLSYTAVNGRNVTVAEGMPLIDMTKPDVNTNMKFLFNHALARIGVKAVAAVDQVGAGGTLDPNTKITIKEITLTGLFGTTGVLNLDNTVANKANWTTLNGITLASNPSITTLENVAVANRTLTISGDNIALHLKHKDADSEGSGTDPLKQTDRSGVTTVKQDVIAPSSPTGGTQLWATSKKYGANELAYSETTPYYTDAACTSQAEVSMPETWSISSAGVITTAAADPNFKYPQTLDNYAKGSWYGPLSAEEASGTYKSYQAYTKTGDDYYYKTAAPAAGDYVIKDGFLFIPVVTANAASFANQQSYTESTGTYTPTAVGTAPANGTYVIGGTKQKPVVYYGAGSAITLYKRDANYFMVVPTQNFENSSAITTDAQKEKLRTIRVKIEYYITTEDSKLAANRAQTKNVIEKDVLFPSLENGKSYNLNLILGLTSVKMEAEVDDWKVINVNADLPQNTAE